MTIITNLQVKCQPGIGTEFLALAPFLEGDPVVRAFEVDTVY